MRAHLCDKHLVIEDCIIEIRLVCRAQDHYDVKMPCHLLLGKLAAAAPDQVTQALPRLVDPLQKTLHAKVKTDAVKQEVRSHA